MFWFKLKAGALQVTLFVLVVIALLLITFILLVHTHKQFKIQTSFIVESTKLAANGIDYTLQSTVPLNDTIVIKFDNQDYKSLKIHRDFWGVFEKIVSSSTIKNKGFQKIALIGSKQAEINRLSLYVEDNNKPLVLVGKTKIQGLVYLPKLGVKPGTIAGQSFYGSQLIYGTQRVSNKLPKIDPEIMFNLKKFEHFYRNVDEDQFLNVELKKQYSRSFLKPLQIVFSNSVIDLNDVKLTGHILVQSKSKIIVNNTSQLKDVVLIAPEIEIQDNVIGSFQALASKRIKVGKNVKLNYPSALIVSEKQEVLNQLATKNQPKYENAIVIEDNSIVKGIVLFLGEEKPNNYKAQIQLEEKAVIYGEIYCNQNTELKGTVYGTVYTNNFISNQFGSVYQNHIYNGTILIDELPEQYIGLSFNKSNKEVLKWLY